MCCGPALFWLDIEKYVIEQVMIELIQRMMRTIRVGFIAIGFDMHAVTACAGFQRDRKGNIRAAHTNVAVSTRAGGGDAGISLAGCAVFLDACCTGFGVLAGALKGVADASKILILCCKARF